MIQVFPDEFAQHSDLDEELEAGLEDHIYGEQGLDEEILNSPFVIDINLLPQDMLSLRRLVHKMMSVFTIWEQKQQILSDLMLAKVNTGDGNAVIEELLRQSPIRAKNNASLREVATVDFREALLTVPDVTGENLEYWLPEYRERWKEVGEENSSGEDGSPEGQTVQPTGDGVSEDPDKA